MLAASIVATVKIISSDSTLTSSMPYLWLTVWYRETECFWKCGSLIRLPRSFLLPFMAVYAVVSHLKILRALSVNRRCRYTVAHQYSDLPDFP